MENKEMETWYNLVNLNWSKKKVLGIADKELEFFCPFTDDFFEELVRPGPFWENDPRYKAMKEHMKTQQKEAKQVALYMAEMSKAERKMFIQEHVVVEATSNELKEDVWNWLVELCNTPEGRQNIALAMGSDEGGNDGIFKIILGTEEDLDGAGGWADKDKSKIMLSEENWKSGDWDKRQTLPHEICHLGQEAVEKLSSREMALYYGLLVEAQARVVQFCDGVTEGRNDNFEGFLHSLNDDLKAVVEDLKKSGVLKKNMTPDDFIKLKDDNPAQYDLIMGRIKEKQFSCVLNNLGKMPLYQEQGLWEHSGPGNLTALKSWVEVVCERTGMRKDVIWPEVEAMATGAKEMPGYENCFTKEGKRSEICQQKYELAQKLVDLGVGSYIISSCVTEGNEITIECKDRTKCLCTLDENGQIKEANWTFVNGNKRVESYENGQLKETNWTFVSGNKRVDSYENGQLKEANWTFVNGNKRVDSYENGQVKERNRTYANGDKRVESFENGQLKEESLTWADGDKYVDSFENGQRKERNWTFVNGAKRVESFENGQVIERWDSPKPLGEYIGIESSKRKWTSDKGNRRIDTIVDGKTVLEEYTDKKGNKYKEVSRSGSVTTTTEFWVGEKPKTQITKFADGSVMTKEFGSKTNKIISKESDGREIIRFEDKDGKPQTQITKYADGSVMTKEFGSKTNKIIVKGSDGREIIRFEDKEGKLLPEDYTQEVKEQPSVASESKNGKVEAKKSKKSLGNGSDDKSQAKQCKTPRSLGNGKGLDDKLLAKQQAEAKKSLGNGKGLDDKLQAKQQAEERVAKARTKGKGQND